MPGLQNFPSLTCARCLRVKTPDVSYLRRIDGIRFHTSGSGSRPAAEEASKNDGAQNEATGDHLDEQGAMSKRLAAMTEESLDTGGRSARKAVEEAGFSDDLKRELEERIASASFRSENASALAQANLPAFAGKGTRDIAGAAAWMGTESVEDASLRMLTDAYKPLKTSPRIPGIRAPPKVDTGRSKSKPGSGARIASARDRTSVYAFLKDPNMSEKEREKYRQELKARFQPAARATPATITGLASLANERIEEAIARGQFKNLPRGKVIERDYNASSPFINTTEYFMNKIIQKQDIVPPWIEAQQEVVSLINRFRGRLRNDWKRHVARTISSKGGTVQQQMQLAEEHALAESIANPVKSKMEQVNAVNSAGQLSQITLTGELKPGPDGGIEGETKIIVTEQGVNADGSMDTPEQQIHFTTTSTATGPQKARRPTLSVFRDQQWENVERSYLTAAVDHINSKTRSYNLMAPDLAKKPYFSLERELKSCFADVAPQIAGVIQQRALAPKIKNVEVIGHKPGGVLEKFSMDRASQVYDERKPQYGFRQFWKDLFAKKPA